MKAYARPNYNNNPIFITAQNNSPFRYKHNFIETVQENMLICFQTIHHDSEIYLHAISLHMFGIIIPGYCAVCSRPTLLVVPTTWTPYAVNAKVCGLHRIKIVYLSSARMKRHETNFKQFHLIDNYVHGGDSSHVFITVMRAYNNLILDPSWGLEQPI